MDFFMKLMMMINVMIIVRSETAQFRFNFDNGKFVFEYQKD